MCRDYFAGTTSGNERFRTTSLLEFDHDDSTTPCSLSRRHLNSSLFSNYRLLTPNNVDRPIRQITRIDILPLRINSPLVTPPLLRHDPTLSRLVLVC